MRKDKRGFTIIELLAVIIVLGIIVGIVILMMNGSSDKSKKKAEEVFTETLKDAVSIYLDSERSKLSSGTWKSACNVNGHDFDKLDGNKSFDDVIRSSYAPISESDIINPINKDNICNISDDNISIYKDDMQNQYYFFTLNCLEYSCYGTNLPQEFLNDSNCINLPQCTTLDGSTGINITDDNNCHIDSVKKEFNISDIDKEIELPFVGKIDDFQFETIESNCSVEKNTSSLNVRLDNNESSNTSCTVIARNNGSEACRGTAVFNISAGVTPSVPVSCSFAKESQSLSVNKGEIKYFDINELSFVNSQISDYNIEMSGNKEYFSYDTTNKQFIFNESGLLLNPGKYSYKYVLKHKTYPSIGCETSINVVVNEPVSVVPEIPSPSLTTQVSKPSSVTIKFTDGSLDEIKNVVYGYPVNIGTECVPTGGNGEYEYQYSINGTLAGSGSSSVYTPKWEDNISNNKIKQFGKNEWIGERRIMCRVRTIKDGNKSEWVESTNFIKIYYKNVGISLLLGAGETKLGFDGSKVYVSYGSSKMHGYVNSISDDLTPTAKKSGSSFLGWADNGVIVIDKYGKPVSNVSKWTDGNGNFIITKNASLTAVYGEETPDVPSGSKVFIATSCKFTVPKVARNDLFGVIGERRIDLSHNQYKKYAGKDVRVEVSGYYTYLNNVSYKENATKNYYYARKKGDISNLADSGKLDGKKHIVYDRAYFNTLGAESLKNHAFMENVSGAKDGYTFWWAMYPDQGTMALVPTYCGVTGYGVIIKTEFNYKNYKGMFDSSQNVSSINDVVTCTKEWNVEYISIC